MLTKKIIIDLRKSQPVYKQVKDLRSINTIAQQILDQSLSYILTTATYSSFSEAINDLFHNNIIDRDILDEIIFKRWIALDKTQYFLKDIIHDKQLSTIQDIQNYIYNISLEEITEYLLKYSGDITTPQHLEEELGIKFNIGIDVFFVRLLNHTSFFNNEIKLYISNQSKIPEYIMHDLKNNINTYINKIYVLNKHLFI